MKGQAFFQKRSISAYSATPTTQQFLFAGVEQLFKISSDGEPFQAILDLEGGNVAGYETLLRWSHSRLGQISTSQFFDVADETGSIVPIGDYALTGGM